MRKFSREIKKIIVKIGSSSITHQNGEINLERIQQIAWEISNLENKGYKIILVSSGAIAAGSRRLGFEKKPENLSTKQAAAAVGQVALMQTYSNAFAVYNKKVAQILVTNEFVTDDVMHENTKNTFDELCRMNIIPIVNENDTISTDEIKFGDNDTLSAVVATTVNADLLILLSDVDGFYDKNPNEPSARMFDEINDINDEIKSFAGDSISNVGTGGMITKLKAASICMDENIDTVLANSKDLSNIRHIVEGRNIGTIFRRRV